MARKIKVAFCFHNPANLAYIQNRLKDPLIAFTESLPKADVVIAEADLLTPAERKILRALAEYGTVQEIADALHYHPATIRRYLCRIYKKLGVKSAAQAIAKAFRLGLLR